MSRIRRRRELAPPQGWDEVKDMVMELNEQMRNAENSEDTAASTQEQIWAVMRLNWKRSRPIYEMRWKKQTMSNELYEWILNQGYADRELINQWRKPGYDRLCCVSCISRNTDQGGVCICRVPRNQRSNRDLKCHNCGCPGCCSGDYLDSSEYSDEEEEETKEPQTTK
ncbi:bud site selection protein 31 [Histomonas meleagridis]|uniref:bud site selection protein 31 n=1 Tax=Histomonas meleagridis TaxID=135588 RepID=UPI003559A520|nr:bud site selection protein 31 [Histomonas meleagridis]KAH0803934.1 bud site selection protein 31 [Histomonas meleagridis]